MSLSYVCRSSTLSFFIGTEKQENIEELNRKLIIPHFPALFVIIKYFRQTLTGLRLDYEHGVKHHFT